MSDKSPSPSENAPIPWPDITKFVRQLSHDLRNHLNAAELQAVYLNELATDTEFKEEIKRLREMLAQLGTVLQKLSASLATPRLNLIEYRAADLFEDIQKKFESVHADQKSSVQWQIDKSAAVLNCDPQLIQAAVFELLENAFRHTRGEGPIRVSVSPKDQNCLVTLREPKRELPAATGDWGRSPMGNITQGHYGVGLNRVRMIVEAHGGQYQAHPEPASGELVSTIVLPPSTGGT